MTNHTAKKHERAQPAWDLRLGRTAAASRRNVADANPPCAFWGDHARV